MRIRRLTVTLPAHMKDTAHHDARRIAEALAHEAYRNGDCPRSIAIAGRGETGTVVAQRVALALPKRGRHGR